MSCVPFVTVCRIHAWLIPKAVALEVVVDNTDTTAVVVGATVGTAYDGDGCRRNERGDGSWLFKRTNGFENGPHRRGCACRLAEKLCNLDVNYVIFFV